MSLMTGSQLQSADPAERDTQRRRRGMLFLGLASAAVAFTGMMQLGLNDNFLFDVMHISGFQKGLLEAYRESCGIFAFGFLALLAGLAEPLIGAAMLLLFAVGIGAYAEVHTFLWLVIVSMVWSQGMHIWMPLPNSMVLAMAEPGQTGRRLGQLQAYGAIGSVVGLVAALILTLIKVNPRPIYLLAGAAAVLGAAACLWVPRDIKTPGPRMVFRRKYVLFYLMSFMEGWRKQIFIAFAGFLLVSQYHTSLQTMLCLWMGVQMLGWVTSPLVGRLIDRYGERRILMFYYTGMTVFFTGYAVIRNPYMLYGLFVIDNAFFVFGMALTTYVRRIAPVAEHTPTLSLGVAMNHVAAVAMPLVGGFLWKYLGYQWVFLSGTVAAAISIVTASWVPRHVPEIARQPGSVATEALETPAERGTPGAGDVADNV